MRVSPETYVNNPERCSRNRELRLSSESLAGPFPLGGRDRERAWVLETQPSPTQQPYQFHLCPSQPPTSPSQVPEQARRLYTVSAPSSLSGEGPEVVLTLLSVSLLQDCWKHKCPHRSGVCGHLCSFPLSLAPPQTRVKRSCFELCL